MCEFQIYECEVYPNLVIVFPDKIKIPGYELIVIKPKGASLFDYSTNERYNPPAKIPYRKKIRRQEWKYI